jgi:hypothetical protein
VDPGHVHQRVKRMGGWWRTASRSRLSRSSLSAAKPCTSLPTTRTGSSRAARYRVSSQTSRGTSVPRRPGDCRDNQRRLPGLSRLTGPPGIADALTGRPMPRKSRCFDGRRNPPPRLRTDRSVSVRDPDQGDAARNPPGPSRGLTLGHTRTGWPGSGRRPAGYRGTCVRSGRRQGRGHDWVPGFPGRSRPWETSG